VSYLRWGAEPQPDRSIFAGERSCFALRAPLSSAPDAHSGRIALAQAVAVRPPLEAELLGEGRTRRRRCLRRRGGCRWGLGATDSALGGFGGGRVGVAWGEVRRVRRRDRAPADLRRTWCRAWHRRRFVLFLALVAFRSATRGCLLVFAAQGRGGRTKASGGLAG
jgi:hypothetical protein